MYCFFRFFRTGSGELVDGLGSDHRKPSLVYLFRIGLEILSIYPELHRAELYNEIEIGELGSRSHPSWVGDGGGF
ncbi:hypothetical protein LEP1GSC050_2717 [Leptospira broomii serovar Hurstbridge str. 5399]|uniref:Uncharacterized protein n=1 Tax=Leptospira broomii serovar Hurstbridge str. 5399 TaxID=1049789 RepID=T0FE24_9LEPT|nr:hypothetical protein LEP1GSC050_2717 [Leptospira broomii serovar Hurstbridge str. 5399]